MVRSVPYQTLRRLAYFEAIAQAGSIRGAAERLGLSVPVLSSALSDLEAELGVTLATRSTRRMQLTSAGQEVYDKASEMVAAAQDALAHVGADRTLTGTVGVTLAVELALHWLPRRLSRFRSRHPAVTLGVDANDRVVDLTTSRYDIAVRTRYHPIRPAETGDPSLHFGWLDVVMVARTLPDTSRAVGSAGLQIDAAFMVAPGGSERVAAYRPNSTKPLMLRPASVISVASREAAIAFAREGIGCALVTELAVLDDLAAGRLVRVLPEMNFGGIALRTVMRDKRPSPEARAFCDVLTAPAN